MVKNLDWIEMQLTRKDIYAIVKGLYHMTFLRYYFFFNINYGILIIVEVGRRNIECRRCQDVSQGCTGHTNEELYGICVF